MPPIPSVAFALGALLFIFQGPLASRAFANPTSPFLWPYNQPTDLSFNAADLQQAWQEWKAAQITSANTGGNFRLRALGGVNGSTTVSEGQGYGMLFASLFDDQPTLDGLWLFTVDHMNSNGLMDWYIGAPGQRLGFGSATDGDEDIAMGLVNACVKVRRGAWPSSPRGIDYCAEARGLIDAIFRNEIDKPGASPPAGLVNNTGSELLPGDSWNLSIEYPDGIVNLSYFAPGYYTVFGKFTSNEAGWNAVNARNYVLVNQAQRIPGNCSHLVPNWIKYDGSAQVVPWQPTTYAWWSYDAARLAWRVAVDRRWYATPDARETVNEIGSFFSSVGFDNIGEHAMNGVRTASGPWPFFVANAGAAIASADALTPVSCGAATGVLRETPQSAYQRVLSTRDAPTSYYGNAWRLLAALLMTGNFPNFFEMAAGTAPIPAPSPSPTPTPTPPPAPTPAPATACSVRYQLVNQWNTGFQVTVTVTNRANAAVSGYTLGWTFAGGEQFTSGWNATYRQVATAMTAANPADNWNGVIGAGSSVTFGFIGAGTAGMPTDVRLNGTPCGS